MWCWCKSCRERDTARIYWLVLRDRVLWLKKPEKQSVQKVAELRHSLQLLSHFKQTVRSEVGV